MLMSEPHGNRISTGSSERDTKSNPNFFFIILFIQLDNKIKSAEGAFLYK